jgi:hypothetical protein
MSPAAELSLILCSSDYCVKISKGLSLTPDVPTMCDLSCSQPAQDCPNEPIEEENYLNREHDEICDVRSVGINRSKYCWLVGFSYNIEKNLVTSRAL